MAIYKKVKGVDVKLSNKEIKATIMKANNWTAEQYQKHYDIFKNKLRNFEAFERARGVEVKKQSPQEILYKQAKAMMSKGDKYQKSLQMQRIESFTSQSISKSKQMEQDYKKGIRTKAVLRQESRYALYTSERFKRLIETNEKAREIAEKVKDPVKLEKALTEFANQMHAVIDKQGKATGESPFVTGAVVGSGAYTDFDYSAYLD